MKPDLAALRSCRVFMFDCVNTVFDVSGIPLEERRGYIEQVRRPEWAPLKLDPCWLSVPAHPDSAEGIRRLQKLSLCVTCSNMPAHLLALWSNAAGITWDAIIPMERVKAYKPDFLAYINIARVMGVKCSEIAMVTANLTAPDLQKSEEFGMQPVFIDRIGELEEEGVPRTLVELAEMLGC